jgi:NitT/TauT family transport system ATP-binding protein
MAEALISLHKITKTFSDDAGSKLVAVKDVSLEIVSGEFFVFLGPSGSGKSTLLRIMSGLDRDYEGNLELTSSVSRQDFSFVFQHFALLPWLTVSENIGLGLHTRNRDERTQARIIEKELKTFGLEKFAKSHPHELSGGMRQRVGIARALAPEPKVIFMDEPFSEIDSFTADALRKDLLAIWHERHPTIVMVTHMVEEAVELADRIAVLSDRPGRIERVVTNILPRPREKRSPEFFAIEDKLRKLIAP